MKQLHTPDLLQTVFDSSSDGIFVLESIHNKEGAIEDFSIKLFNKNMQKWIGDADSKTKSYSEIFPTIKTSGTLQKFIEVAETGIPANFERLYQANGKDNWFCITAVKQDDMLVITTEDITKQKQADNIIKQNQERLQFALKAAKLGSWELDLRTQDLDASEECKRNFGQPLDRPFTYAALLQTIHPDDRDRQHEQVASIIASGKDYDIEYRVVWPDESVHWVHVRGELHLDKAGKPDCIIGVSGDITFRKQSELLLTNALETTRKQQRLYHSITNTTPDLVYVFDTNYRFTYANKALLTMWGKTEQEAIGKTLIENGYEDWHAKMHEREIDEVIANKTTIRGTVSFPHAELGTRIYDYIFGPVLNDKGEVEAIAGTTRDITEFKKSEEKLQESEIRFRNMIEQAPVAMLLTKGEELLIESVNNPMLQFTDKKHADEILGKKMVEAFPELEGQPALQIAKDVQKTGIPFRGDEQPVDLFRSGKLEHRYFNFSYNTIKDAGKSNAVLHMAVDVTEAVLARQAILRSEEDLRSLVVQAPMGICVINADTLVSEIVNDRFVEIADKPYDEIINKRYWDAFPQSTPHYQTAMQKVVDEGKPFVANEIELTRKKDGNDIFIYVNIVYEPMKDATGKVKKVIVWLLENTPQVQARQKIEESENRYRVLSESLEQQVKERTKELQRSNDDLQQFAHVASHDLKEPVRKIRTFSSRLEDEMEGKLDARSKQFIERINSATDRMFSMIDGVLAYSTTNAALEQTAPVNLNEVIKDIISDLEVPLQQTGGSIKYEGLPTVEGAPVLLYQLFYNLVNNSLKFAKKDVAPLITISAEPPAGDPLSCRLTVTDNGIGFEPEQNDRIFETFRRLNSKDKYEGTGLGLSLCKKIVERHGGTITANGSPGAGASFTITLPLKRNKTNI